jgi:hypothetical protein
LLAAVVISAALQEYIDAIVIFVIVALNYDSGVFGRNSGRKRHGGPQENDGANVGCGATAQSGRFRPRHWRREYILLIVPGTLCRRMPTDRGRES